MAKLNGVTTLDMVNGEITKISYDGAEYERVDGISHKGDIILVKKAWGHQEEGEYFVNIAEEHVGYGDIERLVFINGNKCQASTLRKDVDVFRKSSADTSPTLEVVAEKVDAVEKRVSALEGVEREDEPLKVGDYITIDTSHSYGTFHVDITEGNAYEVARDIRGELHIVDDAGDLRFAPIEHGAYTKAPTPDSKPSKPSKPKTGDIVVITGNTNGSRNKVGDIGKVGVTSTFIGAVRVDVPQRPEATARTGNYTKYSEMRPATPAEIKRYEDAVEAAKAPKLSVGDYAMTKKDGLYEDISPGTIVKITGTDAGGDYSLEATLIDDEESDYFRPQDLELLEGKALVFAKAGRKVDEYKAGDIVRGNGNISDGEFVGVVEDIVSTPRSVGIRTFDKQYKSITVTALIAFEESRVDTECAKP